MDETKVAAVAQWPTPSIVKELQRFLVFTNFYWCFICGFSSTALLLMSLLQGGPRSLKWIPDAAQATSQLKAAFTMASGSWTRFWLGLLVARQTLCPKLRTDPDNHVVSHFYRHGAPRGPTPDEGQVLVAPYVP